MKTKLFNQKTRLHTLFTLVLAGSSIQLTKNAHLAYIFQGNSLEFVTTIFVLIVLTLLIVFSKTKTFDFGKKSEIVLLTIEIILSALAILSCCCLDECKQLVTPEKIDASYIFKCSYTIIGILGCLILSTIISRGIDHEIISYKNPREQIIRYRKLRRKRLKTKDTPIEH